MQYRVADGHPLRRNPFKAIVAPRPIGWISSLDAGGRANLAPYSFFNGIADDPMMVMFCPNGNKVGREERKDSLVNIEQTGEFVANMVSYDLRDAMNISSGGYAPDQDEFDLAGVTPAPCLEVKAPRVLEAPASLECRLWKILELPGGSDGRVNTMVIGEVVAVHIRDELLVDGMLDMQAIRPLARCGYLDYAAPAEFFPMTRPKGGDRELG